MKQASGVHSRGYLRHIEAGRSAQFVTWRLKDSMPSSLLIRWKAELQEMTDLERRREMYERVETYLDAGHGSQLLKNPVAALTVQEALVHGHGDRYQLRAWSIMTTHVHCLLEPAGGWTLSQITKSIKGFTSRKIGELLRMPGRIWQEEYFDVLIKSPEHFRRTKSYIEWNPVKAKLCDDPKSWPYSSASPVAWEKVARKTLTCPDVDVWT